MCAKGFNLEEYLIDYGVRGQDCESWRLLTDYLEGEADKRVFEGVCEERDLVQVYGCYEDTARAGPMYGWPISGINLFNVGLYCTSMEPKHFHLHFWQTDSVIDYGPFKIRDNPEFWNCGHPYNYYSTWNRPQMCLDSTSYGSYSFITHYYYQRVYMGTTINIGL